jgi:hypothetical protein
MPLQGQGWTDACGLLQSECDDGKGTWVMEAPAGQRVDAGAALQATLSAATTLSGRL